jgi:release factor glutamine methyltransferase
MTIKQWLDSAVVALGTTTISTPQLDAELLLADALGKDRTWLIAHGDDPIKQDVEEKLEPNLKRRLAREPLAYIRGYKEFYGRKFKVTTDTLIPRPETETLVDTVKRLPLPESPVIHDVGTGSGCIAITLALEVPSATVSASDYSIEAVGVARENAKKLDAEVSIRKDDLMKGHYKTGGVDVITANLPYVDKSWEVSEETHAEPSLALYADKNGLALIEKLIEQASSKLLGNGFVVLEADPQQHDSIVDFARSHGFECYETEGFVVVLRKR